MTSQHAQLCGLRSHTLFSDVLLYRFPVTSLADCGDIVSVCPEFSSPELLSQVGMCFEEFSGSDAFVHSDQLSGGVLWMG